jgi:hypothetical protein
VVIELTLCVRNLAVHKGLLWVTGVIDPERKQCNLAIAMELAIAVYWYVGVTGVIDPERKHLH